MRNIFIEFTNEIAIITLNNIPNDMYYISNIFNIIANHNINVGMISKTSLYKSKISLFFSVIQEDLACVMNALEDIKKAVPDINTEITGDYTKVSITNIYTECRYDLISDIFESANKHKINIFSISTADNEISLLISTEYSLKFILELKTKFN